MDLKSIDQIFTKRILRIPAYQRGYSWENNKPFNPAKAVENKNLKGQLIDLWNDLINIPQGSWHYTGLLTMVEVIKNDYEWLPNHQQYAIVDGQQRITSILILIAVLIEKANKLGCILGLRKDDMKFQYLFIRKENMNACIFGYDQDNPSDKFFRLHILNLDEVEDDSEESVYTENLKNAKVFFKRVVDDYISDGSDVVNNLQKLFNQVTTNLRMNEYILPKELDEYVVFETMNNRGKPLSELEKLKNRLMYLNDKFELSVPAESNMAESLLKAQQKDLEEAINKAWITVYHALGSNKEKPLSDEDFVKNHWIIFFNRYSRSEANVYANHLFNEHFTLGHVYDKKLSVSDVKEYIKSLQTSSKSWNKLHNVEYFSDAEHQIKAAILGVHRVGLRAPFSPLLLAILMKEPDEMFLKLIGLLEDYAFKLFHVANRRSHTGDSKLYPLAAEVYGDLISSTKAYEEVKNYINYYYKFSLFENYVQELFETGLQGFYGWSGIHYFLFKYDLELRNKNQTSTQASMLNWEDFKNKKSIEHIYPQSAAKNYEEYCKGKDTLDRRKDYERLQKDWSAFTDYSPEKRKCFCNSLGNLLAISISDNASFSNDPFMYKVDQSKKGDGYKKRGYRYDSMSAQVVSTEKDWTPETLKQRGIKMFNVLLGFLGEKEDVRTYDEKLRLLGLDFLERDAL